MQPHHQRTEFLQFMNMNKAEAYRKKKLKASELRSNTRNSGVTSSSEMEVDGKITHAVHSTFLFLIF